MYRIGVVIKKNRQKLGISQEELSEGICTTSNLCRMENNQQIPSKSTFEALMQRLRQPYDIYPFIMDEEEERIYQLRYDIRCCIAEKDYAKVREILDELNDEDDLDYIFKQFIIYAEGVLIEEKANDVEEALKSYQRALKITLKDFKPENILAYLLTVEDINLIYRIAVCNYKLGNKHEAITVVYALFEYFSNDIIHMKTNVDMYMLILKCLSGWFFDIGSYQESILYSDRGIESCKEFSELRTLPYFVYHKGCSLYKVNQTSDAIKHIINAYYIFSAIMNDEGLLMVKEYIDSIGLQIDD